MSPPGNVVKNVGLSDMTEALEDGMVDDFPFVYEERDTTMHRVHYEKARRAEWFRAV